ncbi:MAG: protein-export chaperone SecB [Caulobacterales bacterium]|nr:protein-export chaperone SecB [Caulobacterales bacterium]
MSDEQQGATTESAADSPQIRVLAQYVKDLSFENPQASKSLRGGQAAPNIELGIDVQARRGEGGAFEVDLNIEAKATRGEELAFLTELKYSGLFMFVNIPDTQIEPALLIECPRMLFPFARRVVADVTRDGGFPPLFIDPIDFAALYRQQRASAEGAPAMAATAPPTNGEQA